MATTAPGMAAAATNLESQAIEESLTPRITTSNEGSNEKATTKVENSANNSTNHLQPTNNNNEKHSKDKKGFSFRSHKQPKADEKMLQVSDSRSDDGTNTTATKTGNAPDGNGNDKNAATKSTEAAPNALVPFFALYRFHTKAEIAINILGLVCAFASGAAQVSLTHPFF